jgi:PBP1b-binding outer membrane lipoprotein LpoB
MIMCYQLEILIKIVKSNCRTQKKIFFMKKIFCIALFGILFLVGCSNHRQSSQASTEEATEQIQDSVNNDIEQNEGAIDDTGEALQDTINEVEPE